MFRTKEVCNGKNDPNLLITCGRPLGLGFYYRSGDLYIADINYGLLVVGRNGGPARQLVTGIDGKPFAFTNAVDIDQLNGVVYFTDSGPLFRATRFVVHINVLYVVNTYHACSIY